MWHGTYTGRVLVYVDRWVVHLLSDARRKGGRIGFNWAICAVPPWQRVGNFVSDYCLYSTYVFIARVVSDVPINWSSIGRHLMFPTSILMTHSAATPTTQFRIDDWMREEEMMNRLNLSFHRHQMIYFKTSVVQRYKLTRWRGPGFE